MITDTEIKLLEDNGWVLECESPFEMRHINGSFITTLSAALIILEEIKSSI